MSDRRTAVLSRASIRAAVAIITVLAPATAMAHAYVMQPPARDINNPNIDARASKSGPCGAIPRTNKPMQYEAGATVTVKWQETIGHQGCFQIALSTANDQNWVTLKQINDPANNPDDMVYTDTVKLPDGVTCKDCTLVVRQLMLEGMAVKTCAPDAAPPQTSTYYSCADIRIGEFPDAGDGVQPPTDDGGSSSGSSGDPTNGSGTNSDGGGSSSGSSGSRRLSNTNNESGGCNVVGGRASGVTLIASLGLLTLLARQRQRRRRQRSHK